MGTHIDRVIAWSRPDGGVSITHLHEDDMLPGETVDEFVLRYTARLKASSDFAGFVDHVVERKDLPDAASLQADWSIAAGKLAVDPVKTKARADAASAKALQQTAVLAKLKISKAELDALQGKGS